MFGITETGVRGLGFEEYNPRGQTMMNLLIYIDNLQFCGLWRFLSSSRFFSNFLTRVVLKSCQFDQ